MRSFSRRLVPLVVISVLILSRIALAQDDATVVLRAARMLDVVEGRLIEPGVVAVTKGRISAVGQVPPDATVIELGDTTLLPGFIDLHTHLGGDIDAQSFNRRVRETEVDAAFRATSNARKTLLAGFTTVRDFGGQVTVALGRAVEAGMVVGPHVVPSRNSIGVTGGHCDVTGLAPGVLETSWRDGIADGPDEVVKAVRYQIKHGAKVIKTCATAGVLSFEESVGAQQYSFAELEAMVQEAARHGIKVAAHAHGTEGIRAAVQAGVASIEHGSILDTDTIELMKEKGTYLVPTTYLTGAIDFDALPPLLRSKAERILPLARESLAQAIAAGVKIGFGTDAGVFPHGDNAGEFAALVERGMDPLAALRSATIEAAAVLGVTDRGTIQVGRLADLIAVPGNPLENIRATEHVSFVMLAGTVAKRDE
ncbi:MAG TPA: amidohydrolase family protein [Acidobacteriota bacterium]|nr:amidohydrolase family protein [Acidobacteriota bacterium]